MAEPERRKVGRPPVNYTDAEVLVLVQAVADGLNYEAIGRRLNPLRPESEAAIKSRIRRLMERWRAINRPHLVSLAYQRGLLTVDTPRDRVEVPRAGAMVGSTPGALARPPGHTTTRGAI